MSEEKREGIVHIARAEVDEGILDHQVQFCPECSTELETSFGTAGGGFGAYGYCSECGRVRWKVVCDE